MVFFSHTLICLFSPVLPWLAHPLTRFASDGRLAVAIFFTLSGFVLSNHVAQRKAGKSLLTLALARYLRLLIPIAGVCLIAYLMMGAGMMMNDSAAKLVNGGEWLGSFYRFTPTMETLSHFVLVSVFFAFAEPVYNASLWTIHLEYLGSIIIYVAGFLYLRNHIRIYVAFLAANIIAATVFADYILLKYLLDYHAILCFIAGHLLACAYHNPRFRDVCTPMVHRLACALILVPVLASSLYAPIASGAMVAILAILVVACVTCAPLLQRFFTLPVSQFLGRISFPFYLVHLVVICSFGSWLIVSLHAQGWVMTEIMLITTSSTFVISIIAAMLFFPLETFAVQRARHFGTWLEARLRRDAPL